MWKLKKKNTHGFRIFFFINLNYDAKIIQYIKKKIAIPIYIDTFRGISI